LEPIGSSVLALTYSSVLAPIYSSVLAPIYTAVLGRCDTLALAHSCNSGEGRCDTADEEPGNTLDWEHFGTAVSEPSSISPLAPACTAVEAHFGTAASAPIDSFALALIDSSVLAPFGSSVSAQTDSSVLAPNGIAVLGRWSIVDGEPFWELICSFVLGLSGTVALRWWNTSGEERNDSFALERLSTAVC